MVDKLLLNPYFLDLRGVVGWVISHKCGPYVPICNDGKCANGSINPHDIPIIIGDKLINPSP